MVAVSVWVVLVAEWQRVALEMIFDGDVDVGVVIDGATMGDSSGGQSQPSKCFWEWRGIANMAFIQLGGVSRVDEMILARERSGFAGKKYGATYKLYLGLLGGKEDFLGSRQKWSP
ncbi:hypothetical protein Tco_0793649 [Tanacetum coccineum]